MEISEKEYNKLMNVYRNMQKAQKNWRERNAEKRKEYMREWQRTHKEHLSAYQKERRLKKNIDIAEKESNID